MNTAKYYPLSQRVKIYLECEHKHLTKMVNYDKQYSPYFDRAQAVARLKRVRKALNKWYIRSRGL